jgi:hypothetical protein
LIWLGCYGRWLVMDGTGPERVWVQVIDVDVAADREVTFGRNLAQELAAVIDRALAIAGESQRTEAPARIHALTRTGMLDELSRWPLWSLRGSIELLTVFLGNSHDDTTAESIGLAVLAVAVETSMR